MKGIWWKVLGPVLVLYSIIMGLYGPVPRLPILNETIRVLYYHVPMWFSMIFLLMMAMYYAIRFLRLWFYLLDAELQLFFPTHHFD